MDKLQPQDFSPFILALGKADPDLPMPAIGKGMLEGIGDKLVDDQAAGNGGVDWKRYFSGVDQERYAAWIGAVRRHQRVNQRIDETSEIHPHEILRFIERLANEGRST